MNRRFIMTRGVGACVALALVLALGGCAVDQKKEVATYRRLLDTVAPVPPLKAGEPVTLQRVLLLTDQNNEQLSIRGESYLQALINRQKAVANFLPQISFGPSFSASDAGGSSGGVNTSFQAPVSGSINLFNGFGDVANLRAADFTIEQQRALLYDLEATLLLSAAQSYYTVARAEQSAEVLTNSLKVQSERVRDMEARQRVGQMRPLDVAQTQAQQAATQVSLTQAQTDARNGRAVLAFLTGQVTVDGPLADDFSVPGNRPTEAEFQTMALCKRQDLVAATQAVNTAREAVDVAIAQYYPSVNFNVTGFLYRENFSDASKWSSALSANLPIFSAGLIEASVRTAWSQLRQAALTESQLRREVFQDIQVAWQNLAGSDMKLRQLQLQVNAAAEALRHAEVSYREGLTTNLDRITAQDQLLTAQLSLTSEQYNHKLFYLNLLRVSGALEKLTPTPSATTRPATTQPATTQVTTMPVR